MDKASALEDVLHLAKRLSVLDQIRLIERLALEIRRDITKRTVPRRSLQGLWRESHITDEDIAEARREMWGSFPRSNL